MEEKDCSVTIPCGGSSPLPLFPQKHMHLPGVGEDKWVGYEKFTLFDDMMRGICLPGIS